jgi:ribosomal-protein-alanine acetyltransferase
MVTLIPLTQEDGPILALIHQACFPDAWNQDSFNQLLEESTSCGWLAQDNQGGPCGFILARVLQAEAEILTFAVHPSFQRKGIGRSLLMTLMTFLKSVNCGKIFLEVATDNLGAMALYESMGYTKIGTRPNYYKRRNQNYISACVMAYEA